MNQHHAAQRSTHTLSFNLSSSVRSTTRIHILFLQDYEVWALHFEDYVLGLEEHGSTIWEAITMQTFSHTTTRLIVKTQADYNAILVDHKGTPQYEKDMLLSNVVSPKFA